MKANNIVKVVGIVLCVVASCLFYMGAEHKREDPGEIDFNHEEFTTEMGEDYDIGFDIQEFDQSDVSALGWTNGACTFSGEEVKLPLYGRDLISMGFTPNSVDSRECSDANISFNPGESKTVTWVSESGVRLSTEMFLNKQKSSTVKDAFTVNLYVYGDSADSSFSVDGIYIGLKEEDVTKLWGQPSEVFNWHEMDSSTYTYRMGNTTAEVECSNGYVEALRLRYADTASE